MGQEAATAHYDRYSSLTGTETQGHTSESTEPTTLIWSSALGVHSLKDVALVKPQTNNIFKISEH